MEISSLVTAIQNCVADYYTWLSQAVQKYKNEYKNATLFGLAYLLINYDIISLMTYIDHINYM